MLVASGVEFGGEGEAAVALPPQVIGYIQTAIGCGGTIRRASGIAVEITVGDPVCQGDIIETAADGRIGICFIDGTLFNLSRGACLALSEFVCDYDGTSQSALFEITRGTFAFIAGRFAKTGSLSVDTPVGSIRSRAHAGGFGMLSLAALTFSMMKEVQAADPNVTFLDDDSITYKDLAHGSFELVTKEAIPRHIVVEDPGETVVLSRKGSSVSVNQVPNSGTRMEELQAAQQDALANFARGLGHAGSGTPSFGNPQQLLHPINFIETDSPGAQELLPPIESAPLIVPAILIVRMPPPPPTLTAATGPIELDTAVFDTFAATSGAFAASSSTSNATLTFGISGGIAGTTVLDGGTYDVSNTGPFGTLYLNSTSGAYTFVPNSGAINALTTPTTESFIVTVSDGTLSANQTFTININGVNDAAIISGTAAGSVVEAGGGANAVPGTLTATGALTDTDVDNTPNTFTAVSSPAKSAAGYGTFTMTAAGVWTYTLDEANSRVQALNVGDKLTDSFTVTTIDGTAQVVTITIDGTNDAAVISGTAMGSVVEAGGASPGTPIAIGTLTDTDVDNTLNTFTAVGSPTKSAGGYGTFTMTAAGVWTYTLDNGNAAVQALNAGDTLTDSFTVTTIDGTAKVVTITIDGTNDAAVISGIATGSVVEAGGASPGMPIATGTLTDTDVDNTLNTFTAVSSPTKSAGGYGAFTMTAAGVWTYTLDNANSAVQALNAGGTLTDSFTVTTIDGTPQVVMITINGINDAAVISGTAVGSVVEAGGVANTMPGTLTATGTLTDTDVDNPSNTFTAVGSATKSAGGYGTFTMTAAGVWTYTLDNANSAVQALNVGDKLTDSFTVTTIDGTPQVVTITINGTNDAAIISGTATGSVIEAGGASPGTPTASGTLTDTDVDNTLNTFTAVSSPTDSDGGYGTFTMTAAGVWTYTLDNNNGVVDALDVGDTLTDTFTVHTIDGTAEVVTIAIHGASDADPNDFDNLAVGTTVITDPPYVFGTPGSDSVAGGGDVVQIVYGGAGNDTLNGTGVHDTIYGGSGNDTIKGNGGDDTIYGGSGSDTINANNGNDTIIGGFGADLLTGGNGNDTFVYLSVPDSRAGQFDTITDFISGSDKIDLTAFGALGFVILALGSASTSVPAHTIAWLYDSAANETIVYVNPTDHILSIGDSSLLEVHLQGIATIQSSDFVHETTTVMLASDAIDPAATTQNDAIIATSTATAVSSDTTVSGAPFVDANWTMQPTGASYFMDAARSQIDSTDDLASPRFDEVQTLSTEYTADPMAIAPRSGRSNELLHVAPIPNSFAFDQMPAANNADVMTIGHGAMMYGLAPENSDWIFPSKSDKANSDASLKNEDHGLSVAKKAGAMNEADTHAHASDTNSNGVGDAGGPKAPENGGGNHSISSEAGEHGNAPVNNEANTHSHAIDTSSDGVGKAGVPKTPENGGGNHSSSSEAGEHGPAAIHGEHDIGPSSIAHEVFGGPVSITGLEASFHFKDEISVPKTSGAIKVAELDQLPGAINYDENGLGTHGPVAISEAVQTTELSLPTQHSADPFDIVAHHVGGIVAPHVPHDLIV